LAADADGPHRGPPERERARGRGRAHRMDKGARPAAQRDQARVQRAIRLGVPHVPQPYLLLPAALPLRRHLHELHHESPLLLDQPHFLPTAWRHAPRVHELLHVREEAGDPRTPTHPRPHLLSLPSLPLSQRYSHLEITQSYTSACCLGPLKRNTLHKAYPERTIILLTRCEFCIGCHLQTLDFR
jgi:hypothetical protein